MCLERHKKGNVSVEWCILQNKLFPSTFWKRKVILLLDVFPNVLNKTNKMYHFHIFILIHHHYKWFIKAVNLRKSYFHAIHFKYLHKSYFHTIHSFISSTTF